MNSISLMHAYNHVIRLGKRFCPVYLGERAAQFFCHANYSKLLKDTVVTIKNILTLQ